MHLTLMNAVYRISLIFRCWKVGCTLQWYWIYFQGLWLVGVEPYANRGSQYVSDDVQ